MLMLLMLRWFHALKDSQLVNHESVEGRERSKVSLAEAVGFIGAGRRRTAEQLEVTSGTLDRTQHHLHTSIVRLNLQNKLEFGNFKMK